MASWSSFISKSGVLIETVVQTQLNIVQAEAGLF